MTQAATAPARQVTLQKIYLKDASIELPNAPEQVVRGRDEQLEAAVAALLKEIASPSR